MPRRPSKGYANTLRARSRKDAPFYSREIAERLQALQSKASDMLTAIANGSPDATQKRLDLTIEHADAVIDAIKLRPEAERGRFGEVQDIAYCIHNAAKGLADPARREGTIFALAQFDIDLRLAMQKPNADPFTMTVDEQRRATIRAAVDAEILRTPDAPLTAAGGVYDRVGERFELSWERVREMIR